ncbi:mCpol domain-containing protein [Nocardia sp. NPDC058519]|uniref:mCpol domain-containing protein n=1 Tax=Nocardia sp. NPDC058519 TaxID=3346535 RepID=UPI003659F30C
MSAKRISLRYWGVDIQQFLFWILAAFVAGAGPNIAGALGLAPLIGVTVAAALIVLLIWLKNKRKKGIGVFIHLPRANDRPLPDDFVPQLIKYMSKRHLDWFQAGPDDESRSVRDRVDYLLKSILHRLDEARLRLENIPQVSVYLYSRQEEAFELGGQLSGQWQRPSLDGSSSLEPLRSSVNWKVSYRSMHDNVVNNYHINLGKIINGGAPDPEDCTVESRADIYAGHGMPEPLVPRFGVIIFATSGGESAYNAFTKLALKSAAGKAGTGYITSDDDRCESAVLIHIPGEELIHELKSGRADKRIHSALKFCQQECIHAYGRDDIPMRVYIKGPALLAFAAGAILNSNSKVIEFDPNLQLLSEETSHGTERVVYALLDGDDVGVGMEKNLLSNQLDSAIAYSAWVDESITTLINKLESIEGVRLRSKGGDSAIFEMPDRIQASFEATIARFRNESDFRVSCGYGSDCDKAYAALRLAKSSGKNLSSGAAQ